MSEPVFEPTFTHGVAHLMTVTEVMEVLHVSRSLVYRMLEDGVLPRVKIEGCVRVSSAALAEYLQSVDAA